MTGREHYLREDYQAVGWSYFMMLLCSALRDPADVSCMFSSHLLIVIPVSVPIQVDIRSLLSASASQLCEPPDNCRGVHILDGR